jgi:hypothetical protein
MNDLQQKTKSFWERPEGTTGMVALGLGIGGLVLAGPAILGFLTMLTAIVGQAITLTILGVALFILLNIVFNSKVQTLVRYMFKSAMRKITGLFIEIDPIGIMKNYVSDLTDKRETMAKSRDRLRGQITVLEREIKANNSAYESSMAQAKIAHEKGNTSVFSVSSRQAGRLEKLNKESFEPLLAQMNVHLRALNKYYDVTGVVIEDLNNEVRAREKERKMMFESYSAMKAAKAILQGGTDERQLYDQAMEYVVEDYGMKLGEIESFIENSKGFVDGLDIQNGVYEADALAKLQEWEKSADSVLLGKEKAKMLEMSTATSVINNGIGLQSPASFDYTSLLKQK